MTYCFDIDGTITSKPDTLRHIMASLVNGKHKVFCLTGTLHPVGHPSHGGEEYRLKQLKELGLEKGRDFDDVVICCGQTFEDVGRLKGEFCRQYEADFLIDDMDLYLSLVMAISPKTFCVKAINGL